MKMCRLEEVACEFRGVGCDGRFLREDKENHARENSDKHLTLTAALAVETKDSLLQKLLDQDRRHKEEEQKLKEKIKEQAALTKGNLQKLLDQDRRHKEEEQKLKDKIKEQTALAVETKDSLLQKLLDQDRRHKEEEQKLSKMIKEQLQQLTEQREKLHHSEEENMKLRQQLQDHGEKLMAVELSTKSLEKVLYAAGLNHSFVMTGFSKEKLKDKPGDWKSPAMYTHTSGYKFCVQVDANGNGSGRGNSMYIYVWVMPGEYDHQLKWPAKVNFTMELINQHGGKNAVGTNTGTWDKPTESKRACSFNSLILGHFGNLLHYTCFMEHSDIPKYLTEDSLHFTLSKIEVLS